MGTTPGTMTHELLTRREAAETLRCSLSKLDEEIRSGRLRAFRFRRAIRIRAKDITAYIESGSIGYTPKLHPSEGSEEA